MTTHDARRSRSAGFTLIEIMVVIAIIGLIATIVVPNIMGKLDEAAITTTRSKMTNLKQAILSYRIHHSKVPDSLDDLLEEDKLGNPYVDDPNMLLDAWDNRFVYSKVGNRKFDLVSYGADGLEGGEGAEADISLVDESMPGG